MNCSSSSLYYALICEISSPSTHSTFLNEKREILHNHHTDPPGFAPEFLEDIFMLHPEIITRFPTQCNTAHKQKVILRGILKANGPHLTENGKITYPFRGCIFCENLQGQQNLSETILTASSLYRASMTRNLELLNKQITQVGSID